jgi:hypothetical protein
MLSGLAIMLGSARLAGVATIGYASKPGEHEALTNAGFGTVVASLTHLTLRLRAKG